MYDHKNGSSRGFGFVEFEEESDLQKALDSVVMIDSKVVKCSRVVLKQEIKQTNILEDNQNNEGQSNHESNEAGLCLQNQSNGNRRQKPAKTSLSVRNSNKHHHKVKEDHTKESSGASSDDREYLREPGCLASPDEGCCFDWVASPGSFEKVGDNPYPTYFNFPFESEYQGSYDGYYSFPKGYNMPQQAVFDPYYLPQNQYCQAFPPQQPYQHMESQKRFGSFAEESVKSRIADERRNDVLNSSGGYAQYPKSGCYPSKEQSISESKPTKKVSYYRMF